MCATAFAAGADGAVGGGMPSIGGLLSAMTNSCSMASISVPYVSLVVRNCSAKILV